MGSTAFRVKENIGVGQMSIILLLFSLSIYLFFSAGFPAFVAICVLPLFFLVAIFSFRQQMTAFWVFMFVNYFIQFAGRFHFLPRGIPMSIYNEGFEILLVMMAVAGSSSQSKFSRAMNLMMLGIMLWCGLGLIEILNDTCGLGYNIGAWFSGFRLLCIQLIWIHLIYSIYINSPEKLQKYLKIWAWLSLFSVFWTFKQKFIGFTQAENVWLLTAGRTHVLQGGTLIRYFSTFSDAANYGCNAGATAVVFIVVAITTSIKKDKIFFMITGLAVMWGMFQSGTRTAMFCLASGFIVFMFLSKTFKIIVPSAIVFGLLAFLLVFTTVGNGNQQIRRMRSGFDKKDASTAVRDINQAVMKKYLADAPWGIGIGTGMDNVPSNNKFRKLSTMPPDSEYVFIWIRTGRIGITIFLFSMALMFLGACWIVFFKIKNRSLMGIGAGFCGAFAAIQLGGYGNQVLYQYPNGTLFFGALAVVYLLPSMEPAWVEFEKKRLEKQEKDKQLKIQKEQESRV